MLVIVITLLLLGSTIIDSKDLVEGEASIQRLIDNFYSICGTLTYNRVVKRKYGTNEDLVPLYRNWSMKSDSMMRFLGLSVDTAYRPMCTSLDEALDSVALGIESLNQDSKKLSSSFIMFTLVSTFRRNS
jgi:hypothetical protein